MCKYCEGDNTITNTTTTALITTFTTPATANNSVYHNIFFESPAQMALYCYSFRDTLLDLSNYDELWICRVIIHLKDYYTYQKGIRISIPLAGKARSGSIQ